jgi:hypothetical protein
MSRKKHQINRNPEKDAIMEALAGNDVTRTGSSQYVGSDGLRYSLRKGHAGNFDLYVRADSGRKGKRYHLKIDQSDLGAAVDRLDDLKENVFGITPEIRLGRFSSGYAHPTLQELGVKPIEIVDEPGAEPNHGSSIGKILKYAVGFAAVSLAATAFVVYALTRSPAVKPENDSKAPRTINQEKKDGPRYDLNLFRVE